MATIDYSDASSATGVTEDAIRNSLGNLYSDSRTFRKLVDAVMSHSDNPKILVLVHDDPLIDSRVSTPSNWANQEDINDNPRTGAWPYGDYDYVVEIPSWQFDGEEWANAGGAVPQSFERIFAHEFTHILQYINGIPINEAAEEEAVDVENKVQSEGDNAEPEDLREDHADAPLTGSGEPPNFQDPSASDPIPTRSPADPLGSFLQALIDLLDAAAASSSPLVLDLDDSGTIELVSLANSTTLWDIDNDGFAQISGWVTGGDGLLALDANDNDRIDNHAELFGTVDTDGFAVLATYDSNDDGLITQEDAVWDDLIVWVDANENGYSESAELYSMAALDIISIDLNATQVSQTNQGHTVTHTSAFTVDTGGGTDARAVHDVWFQYDTVNTSYVGNYNIDIRTLDLPESRGYGVLPDLYIAMSLDNTGTGNLLELVSDLADLSVADLFDETTDLNAAVKDIMWRWAGVQDVPPTSRGYDIDARDLAFLEKMMGQDFIQLGWSPDPGPYAASILNEAMSIAFNNVYARLVAQAAGGELFEGDWYYDIAADEFVGVTGLNTTALDDLETEATGLANTGEREIFWANVVRVIEYAVGTDNLPGGDQTALDDAINDSDVTLDLTDILGGLVWEEPVGGTYNGTSGNDTLNGGANNDTLNGDYGDDILNGGAGNDTLNGQADDDQLYGDTGQDYLRGSLGNDKYYYDLGDGWDTIIEEGNGTGNDNDRIMLGSGIDIGDLTISRYGNNGLLIHIDTGSQTGNIYIENQFNTGGGYVEWIEFSDTSTYDLDAQSYTLTGTAKNDTLYGSQYGSNSSDTIYGGAGHDTIFGYAPNETDTAANTLYGEAGNDTIYGGSGVDTIYGGDGDDTISGNSGDDDMTGGAGDDTVNGATGDDTYRYTSGKDVYSENTGTDVLRLDAAWNSITPQYFRIGNDLQIYFSAADNITITSFFSSGANQIESMVYADTTSVNLTTVSATTQGTSGNDTLNGTGGADILYGMGGNDTLSGDSGDDQLYGGTGNDTITGYYGNDLLDGGAGDDTMAGNYGDDHYVYVSGADIVQNDYGGTDILELGTGWVWADVSLERRVADLTDLVVQVGTSNSVTIDGMFYSTYQVETLRLNDGTSDVNLLNLDYTTYGSSSGDSISGISNASFSSGAVNDTIYGYGGADTLSGGDGNDTLYGGDANDTLNGEAGNDTLVGGAGNDTYNPGYGDDLIIYEAGLDSLSDFYGGTETLWITGGVSVEDISFSDVSSYDTKITVTASTDEITISYLRAYWLTGYMIENIKFDDGFIADLPSYQSWMVGTTGNDLTAGNSSANVIIAKAGNDDIDAAGGNDSVHGGDGDDDIEGGDGNDLLLGGDGDDALYGEDGLDTLYGGTGTDTFVLQSASAFNDVDVVKDFNTAEGDALDIADILSGYDQGVDELGDFVTLTTSSGNTQVFVDRDGTGVTYSSVQVALLEGVTGLNAETLETNGNLITV